MLDVKNFAIIDNCYYTTDTIVQSLPDFVFYRWEPPVIPVRDVNIQLILLSANSQNGVEPSLRILKRLKNHEKLRDIPKVIIQDSLSPTDKCTYIQHGAHQFISPVIDTEYHTLFLKKVAYCYRNAHKRQEAPIKLNIVVIENDPAIVNQYRRCFPEHSIHHITEFSELDHYTEIDLFIVDIYLGRGKINGFKFIQLLKQSEFCKVPFIVSSSAFRITDRVNALQLGSLEYIEKPIMNRLLRAQLGLLLNSISSVHKDILKPAKSFEVNAQYKLTEKQ